jgi:hypothetical protein
MKFNCKCIKPSFLDKKYSYWENRITTSDEMDIINKMSNDKNLIEKKILHIGIGNSELAKKLHSSNNIFGITISNNEIEHGNSLNLKNYKIFFCDKYSLNFESTFKNFSFDLIIDTNLKSYTCCQYAFDYMMEKFFNSLNDGGQIITSINGMRWFKSLKPKLSFNFKSFFYYKMKEVSGNPNNILNESELKNICSTYGIKILFDDKLCYLIK